MAVSAALLRMSSRRWLNSSRAAFGTPRSAPATPARARARGGGRAGSSRDLLPSRRRGTRRGHLAAQLVEHLVGVADAASLRVLKAALYRPVRSEEHTSKLQSLMRISYAVFCLNKQNNTVAEDI